MFMISRNQYPNIFKVYDEYENAGVPHDHTPPQELRILQNSEERNAEFIQVHTEFKQRMAAGAARLAVPDPEEEVIDNPHAFISEEQIAEMEKALGLLSSQELNTVTFGTIDYTILPNAENQKLQDTFPALKPLGDWFNYQWFNWY